MGDVININVINSLVCISVQILSSPQRLLDAAGPTTIDKDNPPSPDSPTEQKKTDLDLLRLYVFLLRTVAWFQILVS